MPENSKNSSISIDEKIMKAKKGFKPVLKNTVNPFLKVKYADLATVVDAIESALGENGLDFYQTVEGSLQLRDLPDGTSIIHGLNIKTVITDGISCRETFYPLFAKLEKGGKAEQVVGGAHTYSRRHGLLAAFGLQAEDNDGEGSGKKTVPSPQHQNGPVPAPQGGKKISSIDALKSIEGVIFSETDEYFVVSGKTYGISADLKGLGFSWTSAEKAWKAWKKEKPAPKSAA